MKLHLRDINIQIDLSLVLCWIFVWCYGLYTPLGGLDGSRRRFFIFIGAVAFKSVLFFCVAWCAKKYESLFSWKLVITKKNLFLLSGFFLLTVALQLVQSNFNSISDELYHSKYAQIYNIALVKSNPEIFSGSFRFYLYVISMASLLLLAALVYFVSRARRPYLYMWFIFLTLTTFSTWSELGREAHPPLRLLPLYLGSSLFTMSKFSNVVMVWLFQAILSCVLYRHFLRDLSKWPSLLLTLAIQSAPLVLLGNSLVDPSIWSYFGVLLLYVILAKGERSEKTWGLLSFVVVMFLLIRPSFLMVVPGLSVLFLLDVAKKKVSLKTCIPVLIPFCLCLFTFKAIVLGTPASFDPSRAGYFQDTNLWTRLSYAITTNVFLESMLYTTVFLGPLLILCSFLSRVKALCLSVFVFGFLLFHMINPVLWSMGRYALEYLIPLSAIGFITLQIYLRKYQKLTSVLSIVICVVHLAIWSELVQYGISRLISEEKIEGLTQRPFVISQGTYNYNKAFSELKEGETAVILGIDYGIIAYIQQGFSVEECLYLEKLSGLINKGKWSPEVLDGSDVIFQSEYLVYPEIEKHYSYEKTIPGWLKKHNIRIYRKNI